MSGGSTAARPAASPQPQTLAQVYWAFSMLALQGFGGVVAVAQHEIVERRRWMTREEFVEEWAVAQVMPGPNIVNLGLVMGHRWFGIRGALMAVAGLLSLPLVVVMILGLLYAQFSSHPQVTGALRAMGAVAAGLVAATGLKLMSTLRKHALGPRVALAFSAAAFTGVAVMKLPLAWVLPVVGGLSCVLTWRRLGSQAQR